MTNNTITNSIKKSVLGIVPQAQVALFGSRAKGRPNDESDWDILVITPGPATSRLKNNIHDALFPLSVEIGSFINTLVVGAKEWENDPSYYSLHQTMNGNMVLL